MAARTGWNERRRSIDRRVAFAPNWRARIGWLLLALYVVYAGSQLGFSAERFSIGAGAWPPLPGAHVSAEFQPLGADRQRHRREHADRGDRDVLRHPALAAHRAAGGAQPDAGWVSWPTRGFIALCRSFHPIIVAILFVKAIGFGALAGVMALIVASIGFISKLFAEAIEEISLKQVEAVRATGAGFISTLIMGVQPQVLPRFIGFATYQLDSNLRNSTMVGIVGGGGIGAALFTAYQRFDFDVVLAILIIIVSLIMIAEIVSGWARRVFQ